MRKVVFLIFILSSLILISQVKTHSKLELGYEYVEFYNDSIHIGTIKTHSNIDFYDDGYFLSISCGSERIYHYICSNTCAYDINRITFKRVKEFNNLKIYSNEFKLFTDSIGIYVDDKTTRVITKDLKQIIFHN